MISGLSSIGTENVAWWIPAGQLLVAIVSGYFLVRRQGALKIPMLPIDLLRIPAFRLSMVASIVSFAAQMLATVSLPFFFTSMLGFSFVETGLLMTPWPVGVRHGNLCANLGPPDRTLPRLRGSAASAR